MVGYPIVIEASGIVASVGLTAASAAAGIRAGISGAAELQFVDRAGEPFIGHAVALPPLLSPQQKLARMASLAILECIAGVDLARMNRIPLLLCVAEKDRPERLSGLNDEILWGIEKTLNVHFAKESAVVEEGRVGGLVALDRARTLLSQGKVDGVVVAGTDTYLTWPMLSDLEDRHHVLTGRNRNGFIPGEAAGAVFLINSSHTNDDLCCVGLGFANEQATIASDRPLRGDGLLRAISLACEDANISVDDVDLQISDISGEQYYFKEAALAMTRLISRPREDLISWQPASSIGEVGAAIGPIILAVALAGHRKGYTPGGGILCQFSSNCGSRAAAALRGRKVL